MHHFDSWRIKEQLDVICYFISLLMCSTCFGHWYIHHQELVTILLNYHIGLLFLVRCVLEFRCGWVGVVSVCQASACNTDNKMFVKFVQQGISKRYRERFIEYMEYFCYGNTKFCVVINMVIKNFLTSWWKSFTLNFNQFFETSYEMNRDARV